MIVWLRSRWQDIHHHPFIASGIVGLIIVCIAFALAVHCWGWDWTGFNSQESKTTIISIPQGTYRATEVQSAKNLWDWLQLLIVPLVLAIIALVFQLANSRTERQIAQQRYEQEQQIAKQHYEQEQQIALDKQREDLLQTYLDRMSELLLKEQLRLSAVGAEVRNVARARTITVLTQLEDARRISYVFAFLREAGLMSTTLNDNVVSLKDADLRTVNWSHANLSEALLSKVNLSKANLGEANLRKANLSGAQLIEAHLSGTLLIEANLSGTRLGGAHLSGAYLLEANLSEANLIGAHLSEAHLRSAYLNGANLFGADLSEADLIGAYLSEALLSKANLFSANLRSAYLSKADFSFADLSFADLSGADLSDANLSGANLKNATGITTEDQERQTKYLQGAIMPNGDVHP